MGFLGFGEKKKIVDLSEMNSENLNSEDSGGEDTITKKIDEVAGRLEKLSNQIYRLQQRVELLEKKAGVGVEE